MSLDKGGRSVLVSSLGVNPLLLGFVQAYGEFGSDSYVDALLPLRTMHSGDMMHSKMWFSVSCVID